VKEEERSQLDIRMEFHLGDHVNVFRKGTLSGQPPDPSDASVTGLSGPANTILYGTVTGSIGSIIFLSESSFRFFSALESGMRYVVPGVGGLNHLEWRMYHNERRFSSPKNVVDGDLVEHFLDVGKDSMVAVVKLLNDQLMASTICSAEHPATGYSLEDVIRKVEDISRLH